jgi:pilus assembly protein FimV
MKRSAQLVGSLSLAGLLLAVNAEALTLGRLKVLSSLGQPLVAEIEVPDITAEESGSLRVGVAGSEAFKSAGLEYNPAVSSLTIAGKRRADGRALLELRSANVITDPFLDLVLEITWATGRMVRDYTLLLDPQTSPAAPAIVSAPTLPIQATTPSAKAVEAPPAASAAVPSTTTPRTRFSTRTASTPSAATPASRYAVKTAPQPAEAKRGGQLSAKAANKHSVQRGENAATIALANKPEGISLDQMLVALLRSNPNAFVGGNVNRLKTGALLDIPSAQDAASTTKAEAKDSIQFQSRDFNDYRRKLAGLASNVAPDAPARQTSGQLVAKVEDKKPAANAPDRLTLTKPTPTHAASLAPEDKIAKERTATEASNRTAELQKNISDLGKVTSGTATPTVNANEATASSTGSAPPAQGVVPATSVVPPAPVAAATSAATSSSESAAALTGKKQAAFLDQIIMHPLALPAGAGLLGLLGLGALWGIRRRRQEATEPSTQNTMSFPVSRQPTDTVFGAIGAHQIDTQESSVSSTMVYPPSQLGSASGDVDPIAEADVYLAYNRDVQAEEILKEAKNNSPHRTDVQVKLMEIYAKRRDNEAFDVAALDLHRQTDGAGADWAKAKELARDIGSTHALFNVSASAFAVAETPSPATAYNNNSLSFVPATPSVSTSLFAANPAATTNPTSLTSAGLIDFDLSSLTLDLPNNHHVNQAAVAEDPKLALAEEYLSIGDKAGARALIEDVITHGAPHSQAAAHQMLSRIG